MEALPCSGEPCLSIQQQIEQLAACGPPASDSHALAAVAAHQLELVQARQGRGKGAGTGRRLGRPGMPADPAVFKPSPCLQASAGLPHWAGRRTLMLCNLAQTARHSLRAAAEVFGSAALEAWLTAADPLDDPELQQVGGCMPGQGGACGCCVYRAWQPSRYTRPHHGLGGAPMLNAAQVQLLELLWAGAMGLTIEVERRVLVGLDAQLQGGGAAPGAAQLLGRLEDEVGLAWQLVRHHMQHSMAHAPLPPRDAPGQVLRAYADRERARFAAEALAPMRRLAAALAGYWRLPEQQAAAELAAAKRPCANLRCPALGSGDKPRRCASCKVSRYCSIDCQRAAWAAGHRVACAQLPRLLAAAAQHQS